MTFGELIVEARKKVGLSQKQLAERIKKEGGEAISPQYLNDIERDRRNPPSEYLISQFAKELGLSKERLLAVSGSPGLLVAGGLPQQLPWRPGTDCGPISVRRTPNPKPARRVVVAGAPLAQSLPFRIQVKAGNGPRRASLSLVNTICVSNVLEPFDR